MFTALDKLSRRIAENSGNRVNMLKENRSKYTQIQNAITMDNNTDSQARYRMQFDITFSPDGINYKSSLFKPRQLVWPEHFKPEDHVKRFRRQIFTIADFNQIGISGIGNVVTGGFIFGGPTVLGPSIGFSIYDRNLGNFPIVNIAPIQGQAPIPMTVTIPNPGATTIVG